MSNTNLTGYASIDKPWLKHYKPDAYEKASSIPEQTTIWDYIERKLIEQGDSVPALEYMGNKISRTEFIKSVYLWARVFKGMGVRENEIIAVYGPWFPEVCHMAFALNVIGATPYFLKLAISKEALEEETCNSRIAVVFDGMWENVKAVFSQERFEKILIVSPSDSMRFPMKQLAAISSYRTKRQFPKSVKYLSVKQAINRYGKCDGQIKVPFVKNRAAFITSSSGTSVNGVVKGTIATNESALYQIFQAINAEVNYKPYAKCLTNVPPTASTTLCCLFLYPLNFNMTIIIEPRLSEKDFYNQVMRYKPQVVLMTGSFWASFFRKLENQFQNGEKPNLAFFDMPIIGGEGVTTEDLDWMNRLLKQANSPVPIFNGYGLSEVFSVVSVEKAGCNSKNEKSVISVGIPYPAFNVGVFDEMGNECKYNERGELWVKAPCLMVGYFGKEELTNKTVIDGWLHTGDFFEIDENGLLYCYGRTSDKVDSEDGTPLYLFDVANEIRKDKDVKYSMVNAMPLEENRWALVAHLVLLENANFESVLIRLDEALKKYLPSNLQIAGYKLHDGAFRSSPTTAKTDRNGYMKELDGYVKITNGMLKPIKFVRAAGSDCLKIVES